MKIEQIPKQIIQEADNLSKETGISFRSILEVLYKAYLERTNSCPLLSSVRNSVEITKVSV
jgi:hypothetical protein